ncbi:MAG TPA: zinc-ribbon and DUF3426 domain-containing protein [Castellaniella sp.]|uniref:zinc-ribbon and DUF3426 domain-containing protein n=1 Tax=Castellaniella sp. TaxID=1955812 RepID=UPI002F0DBE04
MDLTTRCPNCGTVFEASLSDLQLRKGYIRCVQCAHIFDGYAEVVREPTQPGGMAAGELDAAPPRGPEPIPTRASVPEPGPEPEEDWDAPPQVIRAGRSSLHGSSSVRDPEFRVGVAPWPEDGPRASDWNEPHVGSSADESGMDSDPLSWDETPAAGGRGSIVVEPHPARSAGGSAAPLLQPDRPEGLWSALVRFFSMVLLSLLVVLFVAQLVYVYRARIAQFAPSVRPLLERVCVPLRCRVPYARDINQIVVTGSALQVADTVPASPSGGHGSGATSAPDADQHFVLQVTLRNQLGQPQEWPMLVLDLKDGSGTLLVRRNLTPAEYLGPTMNGQPFAAHSEALLRVPLTLSGVRINGYQLDLFFP